MRKPEPEYCALCWAESRVCTLANVKWPGIPTCREHYAQSHMRAHGIAPYPVDVTIDAPAMLQ
jgi:hypothetical protein